MLRCLAFIFLALGLTSSLLGIAPTAPTDAAQRPKPSPEDPVSALAAIALPGTKTAPVHHGVYLGHGLVLTNWHPWTIDGRSYTDENPPLAPSRAILRYDDDGQNDPGESLMNTAECNGSWLPLEQAGRGCTPFVRLDGAGFLFLGATDTPDSDPVPVQRLLFASREHDIALIEVDAAAVDARQVTPVRLDMIPTWSDLAVRVAYRFDDGLPVLVESTLRSGTAQLLPSLPNPRVGGPWQVPSLVLGGTAPMPHGGPVVDAETGELLGLTWRADEVTGETWMTPVAIWYHTLVAANEEISSPALGAVLAAAVQGPVDGPPTVGDPLTPGLGNAGIDVEHYMLALEFDLENKAIAGEAKLTIRATYHQLFTFNLDAQHLEIEEVLIDGTPAPFVAKENKLVIQLPAAVDFGTRFETTVRYHANPVAFASAYIPFFDVGMHMTDQQVFVLNEPDAARTWFPCNDHPSDRASYDFWLRVPAPFDAVANGHLAATTLHEDGTQTFHWQMPYPMATYLVALAVADYVAIEDQTPGGVLIRHYVKPESVSAGRTVFSYTDDALVMLEEVFGPYPYDTYGHVLVPVSGMALETQTMSTMPELLLDGSEQGAFRLIVHELSHQWFGNTVTPETWADIWLNEGFATFSEWLAEELRYGPIAPLASRSLSEQALAGDDSVSPLMSPAPSEMFGVASYQKGAWLLHMLRQEIGDEAFFRLLRAYVEMFRERPADTLDFWRLANEISGQDLDWFFRQWLFQGGIPRYTLYWAATASSTDVLLCPNGPGDYRLDLPLRFVNGVQSIDAVLEVREPETRTSFDLSFAPQEVAADGNQDVLAQIVVQPIAKLPYSCPAAP